MRPTYPWEGESSFGWWNASHFQADGYCGLLAMSPRHNERVNAAHADGHVSSFMISYSAFDEDKWKKMFPVK